MIEGWTYRSLQRKSIVTQKLSKIAEAFLTITLQLYVRRILKLKKGRNKPAENSNSTRSRWMKGFDENNHVTILNKQP